MSGCLGELVVREDLRHFEPEKQSKRLDYLQWDEYFMSLAFLSAMRSKDPVTQVGACIVDTKNKIVSMGYNGMPFGLSDDELPWSKVCHAELNAVLNKNASNVDGCKIYTTFFPCHECAKVIIQSGIKEVIYFDDIKANTVSDDASKILFFKANVKLTPFKRTNRKIIIDLS